VIVYKNAISVLKCNFFVDKMKSIVYKNIQVERNVKKLIFIIDTSGCPLPAPE
jgi:hypothetical protein